MTSFVAGAAKLGQKIPSRESAGGGEGARMLPPACCFKDDVVWFESEETLSTKMHRNLKSKLTRMSSNHASHSQLLCWFQALTLSTNLSGPQHVSFPAVRYSRRGKTFTIPRTYFSHSGIHCTRDELVLFCRNEFARQMDFLLSEVKNNGSFGWILGSPGSGKSTAAFAFLTSQLDDREWIFTWMYFGSARVQCVRFSNNEREEFILHYNDESALQHYLDDADVQKHFLFLDGYVTCGPIQDD